MGILYWKVLEEPTMIRIAIVVCCAALAAAEAEADPALFYRSYGQQGLYQPSYSTYHYPTAVRAFTAPLTTTTSYSAHHGYPAYQAGYVAPATVGSHHPYGYAASGRYLADSVGAVHIAKREAEADPEPEAEAEAEADPALFYNSFGHQALYNPGYNMAYTTPYTTPYNAYRYPTVYSRNTYQPSYNNFGYRSFYGKREAEAEPAVVYGQQGLYNTAFNTYTTGFPAMRSYGAPVSSYPAYSLGSVYSGYRNFYQPSYYAGYGHY